MRIVNVIINQREICGVQWLFGAIVCWLSSIAGLLSTLLFCWLISTAVSASQGLVNPCNPLGKHGIDQSNLWWQKDLQKLKQSGDHECGGDINPNLLVRVTKCDHSKQEARWEYSFYDARINSANIKDALLFFKCQYIAPNNVFSDDACSLLVNDLIDPMWLEYIALVSKQEILYHAKISSSISHNRLECNVSIQDESCLYENFYIPLLQKKLSTWNDMHVPLWMIDIHSKVIVLEFFKNYLSKQKVPFTDWSFRGVYNVPDCNSIVTIKQIPEKMFLLGMLSDKKHLKLLDKMLEMYWRRVDVIINERILNPHSHYLFDMFWCALRGSFVALHSNSVDVEDQKKKSENLILNIFSSEDIWQKEDKYPLERIWDLLDGRWLELIVSINKQKALSIMTTHPMEFLKIFCRDRDARTIGLRPLAPLVPIDILVFQRVKQDPALFLQDRLFKTIKMDMLFTHRFLTALYKSDHQSAIIAALKKTTKNNQEDFSYFLLKFLPDLYDREVLLSYKNSCWDCEDVREAFQTTSNSTDLMKYLVDTVASVFSSNDMPSFFTCVVRFDALDTKYPGKSDDFFRYLFRGYEQFYMLLSTFINNHPTRFLQELLKIKDANIWNKLVLCCHCNYAFGRHYPINDDYRLISVLSQILNNDHTVFMQVLKSLLINHDADVSQIESLKNMVVATLECIKRDHNDKPADKRMHKDIIKNWCNIYCSIKMMLDSIVPVDSTTAAPPETVINEHNYYNNVCCMATSCLKKIEQFIEQKKLEQHKKAIRQQSKMSYEQCLSALKKPDCIQRPLANSIVSLANNPAVGYMHIVRSAFYNRLSRIFLFDIKLFMSARAKMANFKNKQSDLLLNSLTYAASKPSTLSYTRHNNGNLPLQTTSTDQGLVLQNALSPVSKLTSDKIQELHDAITELELVEKKLLVSDDAMLKQKILHAQTTSELKDLVIVPSAVGLHMIRQRVQEAITLLLPLHSQVHEIQTLFDDAFNSNATDISLGQDYKLHQIKKIIEIIDRIKKIHNSLAQS